MRVTIFGATGGVGSELVGQAVARGHTVRAVVRRATSMREGVEIRQVNDVSDVATVRHAIEGAEVVLSALGLRRKHPANPWSRIMSPVDLTSRFTAAVSEAAAGRPLRLIVVSAAGVGDSRARISGLLRWMFDHSNVGVAYADLDRMEAVLVRSSLDWVAVRPVTLKNGAPRGRSRVVDYYGAMASIRRAEVARWMLDAAESDASGAVRTPMIAG